MACSAALPKMPDMLPHITDADVPWFAFLGHPRDVADLQRIRACDFLRRYSASEEEFVRKACSLEPLVIGDFRFGNAPIWADLICVMRMYPEIVAVGGRSAVAAGVALAAKRGASVVGLGALTAPATAAGQTLLRALPAGITVTTGNAYTAAVSRRNVLAASELLGLDRRARVAVVGCTGSVGSAASQLLYADGFQLLLIGRTAERAERVLRLPSSEVRYAGDLSGLADCDIVLLLTHEPAARVRPEHVKPGTVLLDLAQPGNLARVDDAAWRRKGVAVIEGGMVEIPGYRCSFDFRLRTPRLTFACFAETYLFAKEGIREHSVGRPAPDRCLHFERIAERHGVRPAALSTTAHVWPAAFGHRTAEVVSC
jgi:fatty aldehyde-generating acyl-ACP reductase